jgi:hypothetical protein
MYAYVNPHLHLLWTISEERKGHVYDYDIFMNRFLQTIGTPLLLTSLTHLDIDTQHLYIPLKSGWSVKYVFDKKKYDATFIYSKPL